MSGQAPMTGIWRGTGRNPVLREHTFHKTGASFLAEVWDMGVPQIPNIAWTLTALVAPGHRLLTLAHAEHCGSVNYALAQAAAFVEALSWEALLALRKGQPMAGA